ncbi:hypothetical protein F8A10_03970 [Paracoccus kondratievae]|uniref:hypothetical protein n=1 Tax=Paracoccus kondratievae TaxID=135740 RepID=UPI0012664824|nr:hypothetical protein [Paracoccus kondratievae]QFQ86664.1 hypothetical protein F8A10_03970 [Paracoccus kondratievae]
MILAHEILHLIKRACSDGDMEVAEKLLQTLELIDARETGAAASHKPLSEAYLAIGKLPAHRRKCQWSH